MDIIEKGGLPIGTKRTWMDGVERIKTENGKWIPVKKDKEKFADDKEDNTQRIKKETMRLKI